MFHLSTVYNSMFTSNFLTIPATGRRVFYLRSTPSGNKAATPLVAVHGLGSASTYWLPALEASGQCERRDVFAYDFGGHGLSDLHRLDHLTLDDLVQELRDVLSVLHLDRVILLVHSMNGMVGSLFSERFADMVERLILVNPIRNPSETTRQAMMSRAEAASTVEGLGGIANTVITSAVSKTCAASDRTTTALIRLLIASTKPAAYAAACCAIASAPVVGHARSVPHHFVGGDEDYLAPPQSIMAWAEEMDGTHIILDQVGHWAALEAPQLVGRQITQILSPSFHHLFLAEFRSSNIYTIGFDVGTGKLSMAYTNQTSDGGHSWLEARGNTLYATVWSDPPTVSAYRIDRGQFCPTIGVLRTVPSVALSGYVCAGSRVLYSACGPQVDVFELDEGGGLSDKGAMQTFKLREEESPGTGEQMDFGGLRHGGHSCDLSPDGTKLYVADIGHNCVWMFYVDQQTGLLEVASKNIAHRAHDGPRHVWPHPNGRIVYSLQEHSSFIDVLALNGSKLEWLESASILPEGTSCDHYWGDEVRLSPAAEILFGSTRGLDAATKGYVAAWEIDKNGRLLEGLEPRHRLQTRTSGGWANAIAVCPDQGPSGQIYLTLTDSEEGFVQMLSYDRVTGFTILDELKLQSGGGASVCVWL